MNTDKLLICDVGGHTVKAGFSFESNPTLFPNAIFKKANHIDYVSSEIEACKDRSKLKIVCPLSQGVITSWLTERTIFSHIFSKCVERVQLHTGSPMAEYEDFSLVMTEPIFNFHSLQERTLECVFEDFGFASFYAGTSAQFAYYNWRHNKQLSPNKCRNLLVVDTGYSHTYIVPFEGEQICPHLVRRIEIGGKLLTNYLKELISYRQLNVMEETYVINQLKEDVCYVSENFNSEMNVKHRDQMKRVSYTLPNFSDVMRGFVVDDEGAKRDASHQRVILSNELIQVDGLIIKKMDTWNEHNEQVAELLFNPMVIGKNQAGLSECMLGLADQVADDLKRVHLFSNTLLIGGNACLPGLAERLDAELRAGTMSYAGVKVLRPDHPVTFAWHGASRFAADQETMADLALKKSLYHEVGAQRGAAYLRNSNCLF